MIQRAARLASALCRHGFPVVLVKVTGGAPGRTQANRPTVAPALDWADLVDELGRQPDDLQVTKQRWGAFQGTDLDTHL